MSNGDFTVSQLSRDDDLLLRQLQARDPTALATLEQRFGDELRLFCRRMLADSAAAEDVVQDVLARCCRLETESAPTTSIRGWLYQLCRRRCIDVQRRRRGPHADGARGRRTVQPGFEQAIDPLTTPAGKALKRDRAGRILSVLDTIDEDLRSVIIMRYFQDLPREEIAEAIGLTLAGTKARLSKAMDVLRERLADLGGSKAE